MTKESVPAALQLNPPEEGYWYLGSGKATERFGGDINPTGDWTPWKMPDEDQRKYGLETQNCTNYATLKAWLTLGKFHGFTDFLQDASERYTGVHTGTNSGGNDPHRVAEIIRTFCGMVPEASMPWWNEIKTWTEYYDKKHAQGLLPYGKKLLENFELGQESVFPWGANLTPKEKHLLLEKALKRGPVCVSVDGSYRKRGNLYTKPDGGPDTHWVQLLRQEGKRGVIHDQYAPFEKKLDTYYDHMYAKVYFLKRKVKSESVWNKIVESFVSLFRA